jgi:hypothetical protein
MFLESFNSRLLIWSVLVAVGCSSPSREDHDDDGFDSSSVVIPIGDPTTKELKTESGKSWIIHQVQLSDSLVNISIDTHGFSAENQSFDFGETDPVAATLQADLDKDGFEELYLFTRSADPGAYGSVLGLYSDQDKSVAVISFEGNTPYNSKEGEPYEGYLGEDEFALIEGILTNTISVAATNGMDEEGKRKIQYELIKTEGSIQLKPLRRDSKK